MSLIPQSTSYQEIQRAFLAVQEELNRLKGGTSTSASIRMPGGAVMRHGVSSKTTPPSGETTTPPAVTTAKGRMYATVTTAALSQGETDWVDLELTESADIISIKTNIPAWVRIYNNAAAREADQGRSMRTDPTPGTGLMTEVLTYDPDGLLIYLSPVPFWNNCDVDLGKTAYLAVTRDSVGTAEEVVVDLEILPQEDLDHGGPQGKPGIQGAPGISFTWKDVWADDEAYVAHDLVRRGKIVYVALQPSLNLPPESNPTYWAFVVTDGTDGIDGDDGAPGESAFTRQTATGTTASLANDATADLSLAIRKVADILKVTTDYPSWVRIYGTDAQRAADASRLITEDPTPGSGCFFDGLTQTGALTITCSPVPVFVNGDATPANTAYLSIRNKSGASHAIQVDVTYLPQEA